MRELRNKIKKYFKKTWRVAVPVVLIFTIVAGYFLLFDKDRALEAKAGYLKMTETTDYYHIQSGTYGVRMYKTNSDYFMLFYDGNELNVGGGTNGGLAIEASDSIAYQFRRDTNRTSSVIESNKNRIVIKFSGHLDSAYGASESFLNDGADDVTVDIYFYIYPEYFVYDIEINAFNGINIGASSRDSWVFSLQQGEGFFDSGKRYYGTTTGEKLASNYELNTEAQYGAVLATSTPDWQIVKIKENYSGTTTNSIAFATEVSNQVVYAQIQDGNLKDLYKATIAVHPQINSTESSRLAWAQQMLAMDASEFSIGSAVNDMSGEVYDTWTSDGAMHVAADNNKAEFAMHANATNTWATLSATSTGGVQSLAIENDQGLEDPNGATSSWAYVGNRLPYGSFDVNDPDVNFYWDMNSTSTGQALNKGIGSIANNLNYLSDGVAKNSLRASGTWDYISIDKSNLPTKKGSIGFWFKFITAENPGIHQLIYHGDTWSESLEFFIGFYDNTNRFRFSVAGSDIDFVNMNNYPMDGLWHYIKVSWDSDNDIRKFFIDGELEGVNTTAFDEPILNEDLSVMRVMGLYKVFEMDELYISSDPDQPDAPSYFDVVKYTDVSSGSLTGIPEIGPGSIKWNHPIDSPIWQTQRENPVFTVHDWSPKTKSTTTGEFVDHLVLDLPLDGTGKNENAGKVYDKVTGSWVGASSNGVYFCQGEQGNAACFPQGIMDATNDRVNIDEGENYLENKGTIEFDFQYNGNEDYYGRFFSAGENDFELLRENSSDINFTIQVSSVGFDPVAEIDDGYWHHFKLLWDDDSDLRQVYIDGNLELSTTTSFSMPSDEQLNILAIGNINTGTRFNNGNYDNFRVYNDIIIPYGAYYTGEPNDGHYGGAHPDISYYDDMSSVTNGYTSKIGSSTVVVNGSPTLVAGVGGTANSAVSFDDVGEYLEIDIENIDVNQGSVGFWYAPDSSSPDAEPFLTFDNSGTTEINMYRSSSNNSLRFLFNSEYCNSNELNWATGTWYWIKFEWDVTNNARKIFRNGENVADCTDIITAPAFDAVYVAYSEWSNAVNGDIDNFYITNTPDTPMIPTAFGKPLVAPQVVVNGSLQTVETNYDIANLNDITSWLISYNGTLTDDTTFLITETMNTPQSSDTTIPLDRVHPLISTTYTSGYSTITVQRGDGSYADDFKLIFSEADAGVSSCYIGQGTAGSWGTNLCSASSLLFESNITTAGGLYQEDETSTLSLVQEGGTEVVIRNFFQLGSNATTTIDWHIFADGSVVLDRHIVKKTTDSEQNVLNSNFSNYTFYPATPAAARSGGIYDDSIFIHLTDINTDRRDDYLNPVKGATSSISGFNADMYADLDADAYAENYGAYVLDSSYTADPSVPVCLSTCGQPIYHTIGTSTATVNVTTSAVTNISTGLWLVQFSGSPDLSGIHKRDRFRDGDSTQEDWNIISVDDANDQIIVGDQEVNGGNPSALNTNQVTVGPWYTSLSAWEAAEERNLTSTARYPNGEIEMVECWPTNDRTALYINSWVTGKNNFIKVYTPLSQRHKGIWDDTKYNLQVSTNTTMEIRSCHVKVDGLQFENINSFDWTDKGVWVSATESNCEYTISNNIIKSDNPTASFVNGIAVFANGSGVCNIFNNIIYDFTTSGSGGNMYFEAADFITNVYNNTVYNARNCYSQVEGTVNMFGNIAQDCVNDYLGTYNIDDYNVSEDGTSSGDNSRTCTVTFVSTSTNDFHLATDDTCAKGYGSPISYKLAASSYSDIDGQTRPSNGWDIGADQTIVNHANKFKIVMDGTSQTMYQPRFLIQDYYPQSGKRGSEEEYVIAHLPLDGFVNSEYVYDKISGSSTLFQVYNYTSTDFVDAFRNKGILLNRGVDEAVAFNADSVGLDKYKGSINFWYTPTTESESGQAMYLFRCPSSDNFSVIRYSDDGIYFYAGDTDFDYFSMDYKKGEPINIGASWYRNNNKFYRYLMVNGQVVGNLINEDTQADFTDNCAIGAYGPYGSFEAQGSIDEFKIYSEPILPFGAYYTGYAQNNDYTGADPNLVFYWDAESEEARAGQGLRKSVTMNLDGNAIFTDEDKINGSRALGRSSRQWNSSATYVDLENFQGLENEGCMSLWVKPYNLEDTITPIQLRDAEDNDILGFTINESGNVDINRRGDNNHRLQTGSGTATTSQWLHLNFCWDEQLGLRAEANGVPVTTEVYTWQDIGTTTISQIKINGYYGGAIIDEIYISKNSEAQQIPTAFGKPLNIPLMKVNNTRQKYGYDYWVSFTPDPSSVILQYFKDINSSSIIEVGGSEGTAQIKRMKGGVRLQGGVRF